MYNCQQEEQVHKKLIEYKIEYPQVLSGRHQMTYS